MGMYLFIILTTAFAVCSTSLIPSRNSPASFLYSQWTEPIASLLISNPPPTAFMNTPQLIQYYGYPVEAHNFTSPDGYKSTWFRIPYGITGPADKEAVVIFHGVLNSSDDFLLLPANISLPLLLADQGYDVWLANVRGNNYSQGHTTLSTNSLAYWNFSYHEAALYDIPVGFNYVLSNTNRTQGKLSYVGHSMGTTVFFIAMDRHPELQGKVRKMAALAPVAYLKNMKTPLGKLPASQLPSPAIMALFNLLSGGQTLPKEFNAYMKVYGPIICSGEVVSSGCEFILFLIAGFEAETYSKEMVSNIVGHTPADSSAKILAHFLQWVSRSYLRQLDALVCNYTALGDNLEPKFQEYDYGCVGNLRRYNSTEAPLYSLGKNMVDTMVMYATNDYLVQPPDALRVISELGNVNMEYTKLVADQTFNHLDFNYKANVKEQVFDNVLAFLSA